MANNKINLRDFIANLIYGAIIGVGAILPGVSGGVLCVAFGLYEPLMELLTSPRETLKKKYHIFIPFLLGWALGFVLLAKVMEIFFSLVPDIAIFLFFGLVECIPQHFKFVDDYGESDQCATTHFVNSFVGEVKIAERLYMDCVHLGA